MELTPKQIVEELDKYIIGQAEAKKAVAVALRNRYRRNALKKEVRDEITPKNIIMKGPTGVGKTEIARRLAKLVKAPFVKVEATKYTEVGYVGRDVESMVRDLVTVSVNMVKEEKAKECEAKASLAVANRICDILFKNQTPAEGEDLKSKEAIKLDYFEGKYDKEIIEVAVVASAFQNLVVQSFHLIDLLYKLALHDRLSFPLPSSAPILCCCIQRSQVFFARFLAQNRPFL